MAKVNMNASASHNKGFTSRKLVSLVKYILRTTTNFTELVDKLSDLDRETDYTDFMVLFEKGDDLSSDLDPSHWYVWVENIHLHKATILDVTDEVEALPY